MKAIWIFNANQWKYPSLRAFRRVNSTVTPTFSLLFFFHFFKVHIMNVDYSKFRLQNSRVFFFSKSVKKSGKRGLRVKKKRASLTHRRACEARENKSQFLRANPGINIRHFTGKALAIHHSREYREWLVENITWQLGDSLHRNLATGNCPWLGEAGNSNEYNICKTDSPYF